MRKVVIAFASFAILALSTAAAEAQRDTLTLAMTLEPAPGLDPTMGPAAAIREITYANLFEGLTRIDRNAEIRPALAESWTVSADGMVYGFKLRQGVRFHDGTEFDSADVKYSLERAMAPDSRNAQKWIFAPIAKIETPDRYAVVVTLKRPAGNFLYGLGWGDAAMVAPETAANNSASPIGTGPFKFDRWVKGDRVELSRFDGYWRKDAVALRRVTFRFIPDAQAQISALLAGDVDAVPIFAAPEAVEQFKTDKRFSVTVGATEGETILALNNQKPPFNDLRVRQALAHAVDRNALIAGAMSGYGTPIGSHFSPGHPAYVDLTGRYPYDPAKARALLAEAGHPNGLKATLRLPPPPYARRGGEIVAAQLSKVGIQVSIEPVEWAQWLDNVFQNKQFDMTIISHVEPMDIDKYAVDDYYFGYRNPRFKEVMAAIDRATDPAAQNRLYREAQTLLADDSVNVFLFQLSRITVANADVIGLWQNVPLPANDLTEVSWRK